MIYGLCEKATTNTNGIIIDDSKAGSGHKDYITEKSTNDFVGERTFQKCPI